MSLNAGHTVLKFVLASGLLALAAGCGGGSSQGSLLVIPGPAPTPAAPPPPPPPQATAWSGATTVEISAESADQPHVSYNASGHAMAVWTQFDGIVTSIWGSKFDQPSNTWRKAALVEQITGGNAAGPKVSVDAAGNALVVWQQRVTGGASQWSIYANHYRISTGTWATAEPIETGTAGDAVAPKVVVDAGGNGLAVWRQFDGAHADVWANRYTASTTSWGTPTLLESDDTGNADAPRIAMDGDGNAIAVWSQKVFGWNSILANRFTTSTGSWGTATLVETNDTSNAKFPEIAVDSTGNAMVVWREDTAPSRIASNRFNMGAGTWGTPALIDTGASVATSPAVAMDGYGNALAAWTQGDDAMANRFDAGTGTWGAPVLIEANNMGPVGVYDVVIAADKAGNAIAVWDQFDGIQTNIFANRYNAGNGTWGTAAVIETDDAGPARSVRIANDPLTGSALAVWTQEDGSGLRSILGNHFK
jgi:hypothetical protein